MMGLVALAVKTSVILTLGLLAAAALRRRSAAVRHWILAAAIGCAAATPLIGLVTPSWTLPAIGAPRAAVEPLAGVSMRVVPPPAAAVAPASPAPVPRPGTIADRIAGSVVPIWAIGAALNLTVLLAGMWRLTRLRSSRVRGSDTTIGESLRETSKAFGLIRPVTLVRSDRDAVLVTWGALRPKVVLPADADEWPRGRVDVVLAHELAHIARGDWVVQTVAEVCKAVYWFNPLVWIACARLRHESERACDDAVMSLGIASHVYASELLELARSFGSRRLAWLPAPAMAARPSNLERRVRAMLSAHLDRGPITRGGRWASALALLVITLPIATFAQGGFATFSGTVVDPQDRLLPAAAITVTDARRDVKHEMKTDRNGRFELVGLPAGDYTVEAKLPGFRNLTDTLTVNGQSVDRTIRMQVGQLQETITVTSDDGAITDTRQSGNVVRKRPNPACPAGVTNGVGGNIRPPRKVKDVRPGYPGVSGNVELAATIGTDGTVVDVQLVSADRPELGPAAIDAVRQWEFDSTLLNCVPIEVQMNVSVSFRRNQ
jgi:beta-lactamase regulating signal transducer with metallopeptidase domain